MLSEFPMMYIRVAAISQRRRSCPSWWSAPADVARGSALSALVDLVDQLRNDLEQVADDAEVGQLEDRCLGVLVDHHDRLGRLHARPVLDRARDAARHVQLR